MAVAHSEAETLPSGLRARYRPMSGSRRGAMGRVVKALDGELNRIVAIKIVDAPLPDDRIGTKLYQSFRDEARAVASINHPNVVKIHEFGQDGTASWIVMEHVDGGSLRDLLDTGRPLMLPAIVSILSQLLDALAFCHDHQIVHHDIKPGNILLTSADAGGQVKLADFGIARVTNRTAAEDDEATMLAGPRGTPSYMPPEQFMEVTGDARSDLWAAGILLYELLTGRKPFTGDASQIAARVATEAFIPPSKLSVLATPALDAVVCRALERAPQNRFQDAASFKRALLAATPVAAPPRPRYGPVAVAAGAAALLGFLAFLWFGRPAPMVAVTALQLPPAIPLTPPPASAPGAGPAIPVSPASPVLVPPDPPAPQLPVLLPAAPPPSGAEPFQRDLAALTGCSAVTAEIVGQQVTLRGHVAARDLPGLEAAARRYGLTLVLAAPVHQGAYCGLLDLLRATPDTAPLPSLGTGRARLRANDLLSLDIAMANAGGVVNLWYVEEEGAVIQILRNRRLTAMERRSFQESNGVDWTIGPPFGTDLVVMLVTEGPLPEPMQLSRQPVADFTARLDAMLREAARTGQAMPNRILFIETTPR